MVSQNLSNKCKYRLMCCDLVGTHIFSGWDSGSDLRLPHHPSPPVSSSNSLNIGETKNLLQDGHRAKFVFRFILTQYRS